MNNEAPLDKHNNLTEHMDRLNITNENDLMEQRSENHTVTDHDDDYNVRQIVNQPEVGTCDDPNPTATNIMQLCSSRSDI